MMISSVCWIISPLIQFKNFFLITSSTRIEVGEKWDTKIETNRNAGSLIRT